MNRPQSFPKTFQVGKTIRVGGWVKTGREAGAGAFAFLEVNDGSCFQNIQVRGLVAVSDHHMPKAHWLLHAELLLHGLPGGDNKANAAAMLHLCWLLAMRPAASVACCQRAPCMHYHATMHRRSRVVDEPHPRR